MIETRRLVHVYLPSGYVSTMKVEEACEFSKAHPQALLEWADKPPSKQAFEARKAAEQREFARNRVRLQTDPSLPEILMGVTGFVMVAVSLVVLWGIFQ